MSRSLLLIHAAAILTLAMVGAMVVVFVVNGDAPMSALSSAALTALALEARGILRDLRALEGK